MVDGRVGIERCLNDRHDVAKRDSFFEECSDGDFVGRAKHGWVALAADTGLPRQRECGISLAVRVERKVSLPIAARSSLRQGLTVW